MQSKVYDKMKNLKVFILIVSILFSFSACSNLNTLQESDNDLETRLFYEDVDNYRQIEVYGGDLSGKREASVVVDIGFGERKYYAFTNEYMQLVKVIAKEIILQDDEKEEVLSSGRYYSDEAKVPGVESSTLDEGHVIADSLGGVSNAYNITPQNSTLNRDGNQAYMEKIIRDAGGCTDFIAIIRYPDTKTQIPSHYNFTYKIDGKVINDEFDNKNPDDTNIKLENSNILITELDKKKEYIIITNYSDVKVDLTNWKIVSVKGNQTFTFPKYVLEANSFVKVGDSKVNAGVDFHWLDQNGVWNNSSSDPAELYDSSKKIIDRYED